MGRESHDSTVFNSSIALLQERFRQLQRVKEMREERELKKMLNEPKQFNSNTTTTYDPTRLFSQPDQLITPSRSPPAPPHVSLSLWPTSQEDYTSVHTPVSVNLCPSPTSYAQSLQVSRKNVYDCDSGGSDSGVDTSLHL